MDRNTLIALVGAIIIIGGIVYTSMTGTPDTDSVSNADDAAIRKIVMDFGTNLQDVSLLASTADRTAAMNAAYASYVAPELLATWYPEGAEAIGRYTSSPWPDSIDVVSVNITGSTAVVEGNVLEVAQGEGNVEPVAVYPITLTLGQYGDSWLITKLSKGAYSQLPHRQTIVGFWECLPHKDTTGPQTMECAFGIAVDQSDGHYAVDTSLMSTYPVDFPTGTKVRVSGIVTPANQLSSIQKYDIDGIIRATVIEKI